MSFTTPAVLLLLALLPLAAWIVWPRQSRAGMGRPRSGWLGLALRLLILALLVLSLAGAQLVRAVDDLSVVFLVDASDSMSREASAAAEAFVRDAVAQMGPDDRAGIVLYGADALVEQPVRPFAADDDLPPFASQPIRLETDLAGALRLSLALLPPGARRVVVLSDGAATTGDTTEAARLAAASGVAIDTVYLPRPDAAAEVVLRDVRAPTRVGEGESFRLEIAADSTTNTEAALRVLADETPVYEATVDLRPGSNSFTVSLTAGAPGFARYRVQLAPLDAAADTFPQNNDLAAFTEITGQPRVLVVAAEGTDTNGAPLPDEAEQLVAALAASGLTVERTTPATLSPGLDDLAGYAGVVLVNVNARDLSSRQMDALQAYVRDLGGGLTAVGGPDSYGMGGYFGTPLEETLPVDMRIDDEQRFPSVSLVLVIDRSGSMAAEEGGVTKIQLAAEGAIQALELLHPTDEMTLITVDEAADEIIGPVTAENRDEAIERMRALGAGGGGIFVRTGLEAAAAALAESTNEVRHIVVLADGADAEEQEGVPELIADLTADGVTVSMVSIGEGPDTPWLQEMAALGGGRFHLTDEAANLPQIFTQETAAIQRSYLVEERFFPRQTAASPILIGINETPPLYGYVATQAKDTAQVALSTHLDDPLLTTWQYGLGRAAAWTSDATGRWAQDWVRWSGYPIYWNQAVRWTFGNRAGGGLSAFVRRAADQARLTVDARDDAGAFLNDLVLTANLVAPGGDTQTIPLQQVAPGLYEGVFTPQTEGAYFIGVGTADGALSTTTGWTLGYSPEYADLAGNPALLASLAETHGGRTLDAAGDGAAAVCDHNLSAAPTAQPIWPWLTLAAALLLPLDIAARRLTLTRRDWERMAQRIRNYELGIRNRKKGVSAAERGESMAALLRAKERADVGRSGKSQHTREAGEQGTPGPDRSRVAEEQGGAATGGEMDASVARTLPTTPLATSELPVAANEQPAASTPEETLAARLRKRRRPL